MKAGFCFTFLFLTMVLEAQNPRESCLCPLVQTYELEQSFYQQVARNDTLAVEQTLTKLLRDGHSGCKMVHANWQIYWFTLQNQLDSAQLYLEIGSQWLKKNNCRSKLFSDYLRMKGQYYFYKNMLDSAAQCYLQEREVGISLHDPDIQAYSNFNLSVVFNRLDQHKKSFEYVHQAYAAAKQIENTFRKANILGNIAYSYASRAQRLDHDPVLADSARLIAREAIQMARTTDNTNAYIIGMQVLEADAFQKGKHLQAIDFCDSLLQKMKTAPTVYLRQIASIYRVRSDNFMALDQFPEAEEDLDSASFYSRRFGNKVTSLSIYEKMYELQEKKGDLRKALEVYKKMDVLRDSIEQNYNLEKINELELKFEKTKNEKTIKELQQEKEITRLRIRLLWVLVAVALLLIPMVWLYQRQKVLRERNRIMEVEQRLNRSRMNPHFFFNALTALQRFALREDDRLKLTTSLSKYARLMRRTLDATFQDLVSLEEELEYLEEYLDLQQALYPGKFDYRIEVEEKLEPFAIQLPAMILQPFVENAIEHGFQGMTEKGLLELFFFEKEDYLHITVKDNGSGQMSAGKNTKKHISRATAIIQDRLFLLNKKYKTQASHQIIAPEGQGMEVQIRLPLLEAKHKS
jgi:tetratricopeptide (TPR) repeat protein